MWVVKVGGSLQSSPRLRDWLDLLAREGGGNVVLVPGGGKFAEQVRTDQSRQGLDDAAAHHLALHAMELYAAILVELEPLLTLAANEQEIHDALKAELVPVWLPSQMAGSDPDLPQDWSVTSDSLALWLAKRLQADALILIKSTEVPGSRDVVELSAAGFVDQAFPKLMRDYSGSVMCLVKEESDVMTEWLRTGHVQNEKRLVIGDEALV